MVAPPWIPVPSAGYGGIEAVVSALTEELVARGHDVTLFCAPGSVSAATVRPMLAAAHDREIERAVLEADHVARALSIIEPQGGEPTFDVLHDHSGFTLLSMADRLTVPVVHTLHGVFDETTAAFYEEHGPKATLVAISETQRRTAPARVEPVGVIPNPIDAAGWRMRVAKDDYLLWIGRFNAGKGPHRAITAARRAGVRLILAGVVQPGDEPYFAREIEPHIDGTTVQYVGEVGGAAKRALFAGAQALLMPIRWAEPFGMVMIEALACGTPVIAFPEGAARDVVTDGVTGFFVDDEEQMADAIGAVGALSPMDCRQWVLKTCDVGAVAAQYEAVYAAAMDRRPAAPLAHV